RFFSDASLEPFRIELDRFGVRYELENPKAIGLATNFTAQVTTNDKQGESRSETIRVNEPLANGSAHTYLLGNRYAPAVTVRDPQGSVVWTDSVPFLPQDGNLTSIGVIKVPDGLAEQLGMVGFYYPTAAETASGAMTSAYPDLISPVLSLRVYSGNLGLD